MKKITPTNSKKKYLLDVLEFLEKLFDFDIETEYSPFDINKIKTGITELRTIILRQK